MQGKPITELRRALDGVSTEELLKAAVDQGILPEAVAENATSVSPEVVAELVIAGLKEPQPTPGADAPNPPGERQSLIGDQLHTAAALMHRGSGCVKAVDGLVGLSGRELGTQRRRVTCSQLKCVYTATCT
jgi:hypothetical protein